MNKIMRLWLLGACLAGLACNSLGGRTFETTVDQAIREFEPAWEPPKGEMRKVIVLIVPLVREAGCPDDVDRIALQTVGHFYHMIRAGGGIPAVYRADLDLLPSAATLDRADLIRTASAAKCDACIILDRHATGRETAYKSAVQVASTDGLSEAFARTAADKLRSALGPADIIEGLTAPAVRIRLAPELPLTGASLSFRPPAHCAEAERLYRAVAAFAAARRESLVASRAARWPQSAPSAVDLGAVRPPRPEAQRTEAVSRTIWPSGNLPPERAAWFADMFRRVSLTDNTMVYYHPQVTTDTDGVVLQGATTVPALAQTLEAALKRVGISKIRNEMRTLPEDGHLDGRRFAVAVASTARTYTVPSDLGNVQTQLLYGEPLQLLDHCGGWYMVQAGDGYWGWVREEAVRVIGEEQFRSCLAHQQAVTLQAVYLGRKRIPAGARLPLVGESSRECSVRTATGEVAKLPADTVRIIDNSSICRRRVLPALGMLYIPYVFGARSPLGLDCSGMVNNLFDRDGLPMARDASQQILSGKLVATRWFRSAIQPGDRLYFIDAFGKVFHTGIAISPTHFVHSAPPAVQISSLQKGDRLYEETWDQCFVAAKRP